MHLCSGPGSAAGAQNQAFHCSVFRPVFPLSPFLKGPLWSFPSCQSRREHTAPPRAEGPIEGKAGPAPGQACLRFLQRHSLPPQPAGNFWNFQTAHPWASPGPSVSCTPVYKLLVAANTFGKPPQVWARLGPFSRIQLMKGSWAGTKMGPARQALEPWFSGQGWRGPEGNVRSPHHHAGWFRDLRIPSVIPGRAPSLTHTQPRTWSGNLQHS